MVHETIDTDDIVKVFRQFLETSSTTRVFYIVGEAKLGKSHLLTKVFPVIAQQEYRTRYAIIDLRYSMHTVPDILSLTDSQFDGMHCTHYQDAYQAWVKQPKVNLENVFLFLSFLTFSAKQEHDDLHKSENYLTTQFIKDLEAYDDRPLLLLIDHIEYATEKIKSWLINTFLVQTTRLKHIRFVIAGRSVPEPNGGYIASFLKIRLNPVTEEDAYIAYCHRLKVTLVEQSIRDIARLLDYRPGMFVDYVLPKFGQPR